ncbi:MAG TPA: PilZ domain-containing protein [Pyrinomonadaceae bacterium]|jgi:c-di-GMP-binding flagellar brake protein YcgR
MEQSGKERRRKPRFNAELPCDVAPDDADLRFLHERLECRTRDLSETGVGVVAGSIYVGYTCLVDEGRALVLRLVLPAGVVELETTAAHYLRLDQGGAAGPTYLIGLRITSMSDAARALYQRHLEELSRTEEGREP